MKKMDTVKTTRVLLLCLLAALTFSTALTNILEGLVFLIFISSPELRSRFCTAIKQPMIMASLALLASFAVATVWSYATWEVRIDTLISARKILLLPIAASVFDDSIWRRRAILTFLSISLVIALLSWFSFLTGITVYKQPHAMFKNHTIQTLFFCAAAFPALLLALRDSELKKVTRYLLAIGSIIMILNVVFIGTSRSGYLALLAMPAMLLFLSSGKYKWFISVAAVICAAGLLFASSTATNRIHMAIDNALAYQSSEKATSLGYRMVFWSNTYELLKESPVLGYGTGGFEAAYTEKVKDVEGWRGEIANDPHNQYAILWAEQGLPGLIIFLIFIATCFRQKSPQLYQQAGLIILVTWLGTSFFNGHFGTSAEGRFIFLWLGIMLTTASFTASSEPPANQPTSSSS